MKTPIKVGDRFKTNSFGDATVVKYKDSYNVYVEFDDGTLIKVTTGNLRRGQVKNPNKPNVCGVGYSGIGSYSNATHNYVYSAWNHMLQRCYNATTNTKGLSYIGCTVAKRWHNFQNFAHDYTKMVGYGLPNRQLDKDILYRDNCNYSRVTCCLVPNCINTLIIKCNKSRGQFPIGVSLSVNKKNPYSAKLKIDCKTFNIGQYKTPEEAFYAYKEVKEKEIKRVAKLYKSELDKRVFATLMKYEVLITD